jgi:glucokinase-like ROK family protein
MLMEAMFSPELYGNVKTFHKRVILDMIRFAPGGISRADLARSVNLTRSAVTPIINDLLAEGLVHEAEDGPTTGGRRPILLEINPGYGYLVGIDMGATHLGMVLTDFAVQVLQAVEVPFDVKLGPDVGLPQVNTVLTGILAQQGISLQAVTAIGIGVPGPVVADAGMVTAPPIMPGWGGYPIRDYLQGIWGKPVVVGNDAEYGAIGEWAYGAARGARNLVYLKVGSGVGAGLFLDGHIYQGSTGCAGEIGHVTMIEHGPLCSCGNRGCLESLSGGYAVARKAREAVQSGRRTKLSTLDLQHITARDVAEAARLGDLVAQQIVTESGMYLGIATASLVNLFNPSLIVVGGGISQMGDLLLEPIRKAVRERSLQPAAQSVRITSAVLGRRSTGIGAVVQAVNLALAKRLETNELAGYKSKVAIADR